METVGLLGRKVEMTQIFDEAGNVIPVTVLQAGPCDVLQIRTGERDGYEAVQLGFVDKPRRSAIRSERGHVARLDSKRSRARAQSGVAASPKAGCEPKRYVREIRGPVGGVEVGTRIGVNVFDGVKSVDVIGTSKGRGFAGAIKRHNFAGQRATHGVKKCHRALGGTGASAFPARIFKGKRMPGRYGGARSTVRNLTVVGIDADNHLLLVRGAVPGPSGGLVVIRATNRLPRPKA
jgi:large subunit ribosomal protein L3